jgi:hypothetical protein
VLAPQPGTGNDAHPQGLQAGTVDTLMKGKSDPVITKKPAGAVTDKIYLAAMK